MKIDSPICANQIVRSLGVNMGVAIFRSNTEGMTYVNEALPFMFGYTKREIQGVSFSSFYADPFEHRKLIDILSVQQTIGNLRVLFQRKDGTNFWGLLSCSVANDAHGTCIDGVIINVDDQVERERELDEKKYLLEKTQVELDRFIYSASHDLRSPISSMMGIVQLMKMNPSIHDLGKHVSIIELSLFKLDEVIEKLVSFSENSNVPLQLTKIDFVALEKDLRTKLKEHVQYSKINFNYNRDGNNVFYSDSKRLLLILYHLVKNCFDFSDAHKYSSVVNVSLKTFADKLILEVFDNGVGISKNQIDKVFGLFYRGSELSKGSGLGLFLVREAVIKLSGTVGIQSEYGVGTSITVMIPNASKGKLINKKKSLHSVRN